MNSDIFKLFLTSYLYFLVYYSSIFAAFSPYHPVFSQWTSFLFILSHLVGLGDFNCSLTVSLLAPLLRVWVRMFGLGHQFYLFKKTSYNYYSFASSMLSGSFYNFCFSLDVMNFPHLISVCVRMELIIYFSLPLSSWSTLLFPGLAFLQLWKFLIVSYNFLNTVSLLFLSLYFSQLL